MKKVFIVLLFILAAVQAVCAGDLTDVIDAGVLRVGVSANGTPFAFYGEDEELTGIDIRLIEAIAEKMGVRAEVYEMSAESLPDALAVGQIDAAGGAFSRTAEREKSLDFTSVYYTTGAVFVSRSGLGLTEPLSAASFSGLKIGVRKGSCFEEWLREELSEKGDVPARDIYTYNDITDAVKALTRGRIDLVMMDANIYMARYQSDPDLRSRQYGSAEDNYAFAVRKGSDLRAELNKHLLSMLRDGSAQEIANSFFAEEQEEENILQWPTAAPPAQLPTPLPPTVAPTLIPTAVPTLVPTPAPDKCTSYAMSYVADLTIPDGTRLSAGQFFTKTWRIKNTGSCGWTTDFSFVFASGDQMGGQNIRLPKNVAPGETVDLSVDMYAPATPGNYQGNWQLKTGSNYAVGPAIWLKITVPGPSYSAPTVPPYTSYYYPTADPGPVQQAVKAQIFWFYPNFYAQKKGECVNVYWGLGSFSTAELFVDGTAVYYGGDERVMQQLCREVGSVGDHEIRLCAYSTGGTTCDSFTYTTEP